jgi:TonB family protein
VHAQKAAAAAPTQVVKDAPGVRVDLGGAKVLDRVPVEYPTLAIDDEVEGRVEVEATLEGSGKVRDVHVLSGPDELREAVLTSVRKWNFKPDPSNGTLRFVVAFQLPSVECDSDDDNDDNADADSADDSDFDSDMEVSEPEDVMTGLQEQLQEAESALEEAESELNEKGADLATQLEEAQHELEKLGKLDVLSNLVDGRMLKRIRILELSDQARNDLLKRLPLHEGDKLSQSAIEKLEKAVREFDSNLYVLTVPCEDSDATVLIKKRK